MKQTTLLLALLLSVSSYVYSQANGSFYPMQLGNKTCIFKYTAPDAKTKTLTLQDTGSKTIPIKFPWPPEEVIAINPKTNEEETRLITTTAADYHVETEMSYSDFLLLLKSKFELKNPLRSLRVYSFNIYYETASEGALIKVKYPQTAEGVISKLNCLTRGGFVLLSIKAADHDQINIDTQGKFLALIHIKN